MSFMTRNSLALLAACSAAVIAGCGGSSSSGPQLGNIKMGVSTNSSIQANINHITLTINQGNLATAGNTTPMADVVVELTKAPAGNTWTGAIANIPAGSARLFKAGAYNAAGTAAANLIYYGETVANVSAGNTASVTILLQETNVTPGPTRYSPQITAITASNSYVLPSTPVTLSATAVDPDHQGDPLSFNWSAVCDSGGSGAFQSSGGTLTTLTTAPYDPAHPGFTSANVFTPPAVNATCQVAIQVKEAALAGNQNTPLSVTTYFTIVVNANFGKAIVAGFPNSYPIVFVRGDFRYNYFSDVTLMPVGQQADLQFYATDPDGDNVEYSLQTKCGTDLTAAASATPLTDNYFFYVQGGSNIGGATSTGGEVYRALTSTGVTPPLPYSSAWFPHFGVSPASTFTDPAQDCIFTVTVHDLCTAGNCNPGTQGGAADGSYKTTSVGGAAVTSFTTGVINAKHPAKPQRAPVVDSTSTPNQDGPAATGVQSWDPQKKAFVNPSSAYNLTAAADDRWQSGVLAVAWSCNTGSVSAPVNTTGVSQPGYVSSAVVFTTGAAVPPTAQCTATFTSSNSGLSSVVTFQFIKKDFCAINGFNAGQACSSGNACITGETCNSSFSCSGGSAVVCGVSDTQCQTPICDPALGCGINNAANGTACNKDSNGCTQNDSCQAGSCTAGAAVTCGTPTDGQCQSASGSCHSTGNNTFACSYPAINVGGSCNADNNGCTQDTCVSASDGFGGTTASCAVGATATCPAGTNVCQSGTGTCVSTANFLGFTCQYTNLPNTTSCNVAGTCVSGQKCDGVGNCGGGTPTCQPEDNCSPTTPVATCSPTNLVPTHATDIQLTPPSGAAITTGAVTFLTAPFYSNTPISFGGGFSYTSTGDADIVVLKYDKSGAIQAGVGVGDDDPTQATTQYPRGLAVTQAGQVAVVGNYTGAMTFGTSAISSPGGADFLVAFDSSLNRLWAKSLGDGANGQIPAVAANPSSTTNRIAICGRTSIKAVWTGAAAYAGGSADAVIGVYDSAGNQLWAKELGNGNFYESCTAVAVDDNGDVFAAGQFDSATLPIGSFTLTGPAAAAGQKWIWVAKFNGATGAALNAVAYATTAGQAFPARITADATGALVMGGTFTSTLTIGALLSSAGSNDAFIAKLDGTALTPVWNAKRFGGTGSDSLNGVAVTSYGDIIVTGGFSNTTTGFATLTSAGNADLYVAKLDGDTGAVDVIGGTPVAYGYGDASAQNGDVALVNRYGATPNDIAIVGTFGGTLNFGGGVSATAVNTDVVLLNAILQ